LAVFFFFRLAFDDGACMIASTKNLPEAARNP